MIFNLIDPFLFCFSTKRLKEQERIPYNTAKRTKEDAMKQKQFGSLEIVITKRKLQVPTTPVKKRKGSQSKCIGKTSTNYGLPAVLF